MSRLDRKQRRLLLRILVSGALLGLCCLLPLTGWPRLLCFAVPYAVAGWDVLRSAARNVIRGSFLDEKFLMSVATLGAFVLGEYPEAVFVMVFFQVGELFESVAAGASRRSIAALMDLRPDTACVERDGELVETDPEEVAVGEIILVKPGERVPLDGVVVSGSTGVDTSALTGETLPRDLGPGDAAVSGCVNLSAAIRVRVTRPCEESTVSRILELVEESAARKSRSETFIARFAAWYTPVVVAAALALAVLPGILTGNWAVWVHRALVFLVTSCPCALLLSVPLAGLGGMGCAGKRGILIKGSGCMDALARAEIAAFDKTGTLTEGRFSVRELYPSDCTPEELSALAATAECRSDHPIAVSLREYYGRPVDTSAVTKAEEHAGHGVRVLWKGRELLAGRRNFLEARGVPCPPPPAEGTAVYVAEDGAYRGCLVIGDRVRPDAAEALAGLKALGVRKTVLLTGDHPTAAKAAAKALGLDEYRAELLPADKVAAVETLLSETAPGGTVLFTGDGLNDAPVLSRADVGVAMGGLGADAAIEAADVVLMDDRPGKLPLALTIARKTRRVVWENIVFCLAVKLAVLALAVPGLADMWLASFADVGVCVLAVLNSMRTLRP